MDNELRCVSHEIRNQISVCELYTQVIRKNLSNIGVKNDSIDNAIECITKSLKLMSCSLADLKSMDNFLPRRCQLKDILKSAIDLSVVYVQKKDIEITLSCNDGCDVYIDEDKFLACGVNIIKNAIEAIDKKGFVRIEVYQNDDNVRILFINNGSKIPDGVDIFKQGFTTKKTGSGLGLAICKENLKLQGADIKLNKSTEDLTEFEIVLAKY